MNIKQVGGGRAGVMGLYFFLERLLQYLLGYPTILHGYPRNIHTFMPSIGSWCVIINLSIIHVIDVICNVIYVISDCTAINIFLLLWILEKNYINRTCRSCFVYIIFLKCIIKQKYLNPYSLLKVSTNLLRCQLAFVFGFWVVFWTVVAVQGPSWRLHRRRLIFLSTYGYRAWVPTIPDHSW